MTAGNMLLEAAAHAGYYALMTRSSGPQIRGGEAAAMLRVACEPVECMEDQFHVLAAVDWENVQRFRAEIPLGVASLIVGDPDQGEPPDVFLSSGAARATLPLKRLAKSVPDGRPNMWLLGALAELLGCRTTRSPRGREDPGQATCGSGAQPCRCRGRAHGRGRHRGSFRTGRTARHAPAALAADRQRGRRVWRDQGWRALRGGIPDHAATELLEWMSPALAEVGGTLVQAEDELASINMAIGGSYGGVPRSPPRRAPDSR